MATSSTELNDLLDESKIMRAIIPNQWVFERKLRELSHVIKTSWWSNLTRTLSITNAAVSEIDPKIPEDDPRPRIYIPPGAPEQFEYYSKLAKSHPKLRLDVRSLPKRKLTADYIKTLNTKPGLLALAMENKTNANGETHLEPAPFVVPGGRFSEMYGWDTYFIVLGLLTDGYVDLCESILKNFCFCIKHYGKVFNANRTYYLGRSQPPFLTSMGRAICEKMGKENPKTLELARLTLLAAIKEYYNTWMSKPRYDEETGLSRYFGEGKGFPPEVEPEHFDEVIAVYAKQHGIDPSNFRDAYNSGKVRDKNLDKYLEHDRSGRESGHDTTYRFIGRGANLACVDLNSCLYKYETDIAHMLDTYFNGWIAYPDDWRASRAPAGEPSWYWTTRAETRRDVMNKYLWCDAKGMYFDYDIVEHRQMSYENATTFWPLWAGAATNSQAEAIVKHALPRLEVHGGIVATTEASRGKISPARPQRQWDYPHGWAPHQMLAWDGLRKYSYIEEMERLVYRWLAMVVRTFTDCNGLVVEKYDVTSTDKAHVAEAEYGNQGSDFNSPVQTG